MPANITNHPEMSVKIPPVNYLLAYLLTDNYNFERKLRWLELSAVRTHEPRWKCPCRDVGEANAAWVIPAFAGPIASHHEARAAAHMLAVHQTVDHRLYMKNTNTKHAQ